MRRCKPLVCFTDNRYSNILSIYNTLIQYQVHLNRVSLRKENIKDENIHEHETRTAEHLWMPKGSSMRMAVSLFISVSRGRWIQFWLDIYSVVELFELKLKYAGKKIFCTSNMHMLEVQNIL